MSDNHDHDSETPPSDGALHGLLAEYDSPGALKAAAAKVRDAGFKKWDCYSPFPVHGIDPAMGIKRTILPQIVFGAGLSGLIGGLGLQWWASAYHWPNIVSGKPFFSIPANIPITFETTVLASAVTCFLAVWALSDLPKPWHPLFRNPRFKKVTTDGFFIGVDAADPKFDHERTAGLLRDAGATAVEDVRIDPDPGKKTIPKPIIAFIIMTTVLALVPFALIAKARASKSDKPHWHILPDMDFQTKYKAQRPSDFFADGRADRMPVEGTVAAGELRADDHFYRGTIGSGEGAQWATTFPDNDKFEVSASSMQRGRERYNIFCAPCHGEAGDGGGMIAQRAVRVPSKGWVPPANLAERATMPVGQLFYTISQGFNTMRGYAPQIPEADRWAIALYVRALQRSQNASLTDVPADQQGSIR
jgi:mono/diheme cytochrome c family protein